MTVRRRARGFTLIEILLATALLAAGLALAFATLRAATATVERGEAMAERNERMRAVEQFLRRRLAASLAVGFALDEETGAPIRFVGEPERVRFVADLPNYLGRGGPHLHDIAVLEGAQGEPVLAASFAMVLAGETVAEDAPRPPEPLVRDLAEARFRYRGIGADGVLGEWQDQWENVETLPLQVSVEIASAGGGAWPPLVVALPQSTGETGPGVFGGGNVAGRGDTVSGRISGRGSNIGRGPRQGRNSRLPPRNDRGVLLDGGEGRRGGGRR